MYSFNKNLKKKQYHSCGERVLSSRTEIVRIIESLRLLCIEEWVQIVDIDTK